jgi:thiamine-phosphate pyrophosphorylase
VILHLVTDRRRLAGSVAFADAQRCLLQQVDYAIAARIDGVIVRERDLEARDLTSLTMAMVKMTRGTATRVLVNDRLDVALASGADGVHLRADSITSQWVRRIAPRRFLVGRSVHDADEARQANGVDYLIAGTVWPSASKPAHHRLLGIDGFAEVVSAVRVPVLAIGGVEIARAREVARAGGAGIAAIGLFMDESAKVCRAVQIEDISRELRSRFDTSGSAS